MSFAITKDDVGRHVRRKSTGEIGEVSRDPGNGWLHPTPYYEWQLYRDDWEYVLVTCDPKDVRPRGIGAPYVPGCIPMGY